MVEVLIRAQDHDGNDPWEATTHLPIIPVAGMSLEVWINSKKEIPLRAFDDEAPEDGGPSERERVVNAFYTDQPVWIEVKDVILNTYAPERVEVWVSSDGHSSDQMKRIIYAIHRKEQP